MSSHVMGFGNRFVVFLEESKVGVGRDVGFCGILVDVGVMRCTVVHCP
jgi:hypothetical protein